MFPGVIIEMGTSILGIVRPIVVPSSIIADFHSSNIITAIFPNVKRNSSP
jgi:hypothetical protein